MATYQYPYILYSSLMLLYSILSWVERCGLIAHWAKLVFLHLGERSELGANVAACGFLDGITITDRLRLRDFNGIVQGNSQQTLFNTATWEIFILTVYVCTPLPKKIQVPLITNPFSPLLLCIICCKERFLKQLFSLLFNCARSFYILFSLLINHKKKVRK